MNPFAIVIKPIAISIVMGAILLGTCQVPPATLDAGVQASVTDYYVSPSGDDSNPGTMAEPWRTIGKANQELQPGDTVYIRAGTYDEVIEPFNSGQAGAKITYTNYQNEEVIIRGEPGKMHVVVIGWKVNGPSGPDSYIVIDGLTISYGHELDDMRFGWVFLQGSDSRYNEIRNNRIIRQGDPLQNHKNDYREWGIILDRVKYTLVENNYITGVNMGLHIKNAAQFNVIRDNTISGTGQSTIVIATSRGTMQGNLIENNILERSAIEDGIQFMPDYGASNQETDISNFGTIVRDNIIRYNAENAIDLKGAAHVVIEGNIIYGTGGDNDGLLDGGDRNSPGAIMRGSRTSTRDIIIRNNVLYDNANGIRMFDGYRVYNNTIIASNRDFNGPNSSYTTGGSPAFWALRWDEGSGYIQNNIIASHNVAEVVLSLNRPISINHNLYYNPDGAYFADYRGKSNWDRVDFEDWQGRLAGSSSIIGDDAASFVSDPLFVNAPAKPVGDHGSFDFHLTSGSPGIDAGGPLTRVKGSGSGTQIQLEDVGYFFDGYGIVAGDLIQVGPDQRVRVTGVNYANNTITVAKSITWTDGMGVNLPFEGAAPDIGAFEFTGTQTAFFVDVAPDHPYYAAIKTLYDKGYISGCSDTPLMFCPDQTMTRSESAVFIERGLWGAGFLPPNPTLQLFADLSTSSWAAKWASSLFIDGFTAGCSTDPLAYCPWDGHTRTEGTVFYLRMLNGANYVPPAPTGFFTDVPVDFWGAKWIESAYLAGLIPACDQNPLRFCPDDPLSRGLAAWMMVQAKGLN